MPALTNLTAANQTISVKAGDLGSSALREINVLSQGETASAEDADCALENLQRRIDLVNAQKRLIYNVNFDVFTLQASHSPHTIGPAGDFNIPNPPVELVSAALMLASGATTVDLPLQVLTQAEYSRLGIKNLTSTLPTSVYYSRDFPLGNLYFWPIPTQVNQVRLELWQNLPQALASTTALAMPPAYWAYLLCAVAADMAPSYGPNAMEVVTSEAFRAKYREARNAIQDNNSEVPPLISDAPSSRKGSAIPDFNFLTGFRR